MKLRHALLLICLCISTALPAQETPVPAPPGTTLQSVWHLGRVTGDLERIIAFYHDLLGLGFRGERGAPIAFYSVAAINEFVGSPAHAEFRAAFMPIPGASAETDPARQVYLEAFEYRNIERHQYMPALSDPGVSMLSFVVRDLDALVADAKAAGVAFVTAADTPIDVPSPTGNGVARAVILRDPDGYPVELVEISPAPATFADTRSRVLGARMSLVVADIEQALQAYAQLLGVDPLRVPDWRNDSAFTTLRGLPAADFRRATLDLPGTTLAFDLIEYRGLEQQPYRPAFQDIGFGHIAFNTNDIEAVFARMQELDMTTLAASGTWTQINPNLRALYTRDANGFFLEIIENRATP